MYISNREWEALAGYREENDRLRSEFTRITGQRDRLRQEILRTIDEDWYGLVGNEPGDYIEDVTHYLQPGDLTSE